MHPAHTDLINSRTRVSYSVLFSFFLFLFSFFFIFFCSTIFVVFIPCRLFYSFHQLTNSSRRTQHVATTETTRQSKLPFHQSPATFPNYHWVAGFILKKKIYRIPFNDYLNSLAFSFFIANPMIVFFFTTRTFRLAPPK